MAFNTQCQKVVVHKYGRYTRFFVVAINVFVGFLHSQLQYLQYTKRYSFKKVEKIPPKIEK